MTEKPYTDADVGLLATAIAETRTDCEPLYPCYACRISARVGLDALAAAGRLGKPGEDDG